MIQKYRCTTHFQWRVGTYFSKDYIEILFGYWVLSWSKKYD